MQAQRMAVRGMPRTAAAWHQTWQCRRWWAHLEAGGLAALGSFVCVALVVVAVGGVGRVQAREQEHELNQRDQPKARVVVQRQAQLAR